MNKHFQLTTFDLVVVVLLLVVSAGALYPYLTAPQSREENSVKYWLAAMSKGSLPEVKTATTPEFYRSFVSHFGEEKYRAVNRAFELSARLGYPAWAQLRWKAEQAADKEYRDLHDKVQKLGKDAFTRLSPEERLKLMDDPQSYRVFVLKSGIAALPSADRDKIRDTEAFIAGTDRDSFVGRYGYALLSPEDQQQLGAPAALANGETPEKMNFLDKVARPQWTPEMRRELEGITRADLLDREAFLMHFGEPLAQEFLSQRPPHASLVNPNRPCGNDRLITGGLLPGAKARCKVTFGEGFRAEVSLVKTGWNWRVAGSTVAPYDVPVGR